MNDRPELPPVPFGGRGGDHSPEGRWVTYEELGRVRGIGRESAVKLVQRKRWRRIPGNDGVARVLVPSEWLTTAKTDPPLPHPEGSGEHSPGSAAFETALDAMRVAQAGETAALQERAEAAERRADVADADRRSAQARAELAEAARDTADTDRRAALALAEQSIGALADAVARADRAEQGRDAERARADEQRDQIEVLRVQLAQLEAEGAASDVQAAELTTQLKQARADAEELRQTDAVRKARGRLRRAWDGWRGR